MSKNLSPYPHLIHYERTPLIGSGLERPYQNGYEQFAYVLIEPRSNYVQFGIGISSGFGLNVSHQLLENIHYLHVWDVSNHVREGVYPLHDGKVSRSIYDLSGEKKSRSAYDRNSRPLNVCMRGSDDIADMIVRARRSVFGNPAADGLSLEIEDDLWSDYRLVVFHDAFLDRITLGVSPIKNDRSKCDFAEFARLSRRQVDQAAERWGKLSAEGEGVCFGIPREFRVIPQIYLFGTELADTVRLIRMAATAAWPEPNETSGERRQRTRTKALAQEWAEAEIEANAMARDHLMSFVGG